jgi:hypothetical protein
MFEGVRYSEALGRAGEHSSPSYTVHKVAPGEYDPRGTGKAVVPLVLVTEDDDIHCRVRVEADSPWVVGGSQEQGYTLVHEGRGESRPVQFEPNREWMSRATSDGVPGAASGVLLHADMAVVNVAPGCQYFTVPKANGVSARCTFCTYGKPDQRIPHFDQRMDEAAIPQPTLQRLQEALSAAIAESSVTTIYLVGGSMTDPAAEGERFIQLARSVQEVNSSRIPVFCGSGALPDTSLKELREQQLVDGVCFNLEVWGEEAFGIICPGKARFVGYRGWIESLEHSVELWGRGRVYSAMVGGVELGPELGMSVDEAVAHVLRGAEDLCQRGIMPIYSLSWPPPGPGAREYFERLQLGYADLRQQYGLSIWEGFLSHRSSYMQLECDLDRARAGEANPGDARLGEEK